jgi:hypothetical protein
MADFSLVEPRRALRARHDARSLRDAGDTTCFRAPVVPRPGEAGRVVSAAKRPSWFHNEAMVCDA